MKTLKEHIVEGLKIGTNTKVNQRGTFTDEELRKDYEDASTAYTKAEKDEFKYKYGVNTNKIKDIQIEILNYLRDNRNKKTKFDDADITDFIRYDLPSRYDEIKKYFDKESENFLNYVLKYYQDKATKQRILKKPPSYRSSNDRYILNRISQLEKYFDVF